MRKSSNKCQINEVKSNSAEEGEMQKCTNFFNDIFVALMRKERFWSDFFHPTNLFFPLISFSNFKILNLQSLKISVIIAKYAKKSSAIY